MSGQVELARLNENRVVSTLPQNYGLIALTVVAVSVAASGLAVAGRLDSAYGIAIPAIACLAGFLGALAPRVVLTLLFATAPLLWALGDASIFEGEHAHVNLPMFVGFIVVVAFCHL